MRILTCVTGGRVEKIKMNIDFIFEQLYTLACVTIIYSNCRFKSHMSNCLTSYFHIFKSFLKKV